MKTRDRFSAIEADISALAAEAIVNAANKALIMGGGVDGAIRRKAGEEMETELRRIGRCPTGQAVLTRGHRLNAEFVIHTVAPVWQDGDGLQQERIRLLADCYRNSLLVARANGISEIAFPCIGTGIYGWPADLAARTAFETVTSVVQNDPGFWRIIFCCFSPLDRNRYDALIRALA